MSKFGLMSKVCENVANFCRPESEIEQYFTIKASYFKEKRVMLDFIN